MPLRQNVSPAARAGQQEQPPRGSSGLDRDVIRIGPRLRIGGRARRPASLAVARPESSAGRRAFFVEDLDSHNLTYLDDRMLTPKTPVPLRATAAGSRSAITTPHLPPARRS